MTSWSDNNNSKSRLTPHDAKLVFEAHGVGNEPAQNPLEQRAKLREPNIWFATIGAAVLAGLGVNEVARSGQPQRPNMGGPHREYTVQAGDTEAKILTSAYPEKDWRNLTGIIDSQIPKAARETHTLQPGEKISFGNDAQIGKEVDAGSEAASAG